MLPATTLSRSSGLNSIARIIAVSLPLLQPNAWVAHVRCRQGSALASAARSVGAPWVGSTRSTGSSSSGRRRSTTCSRVTPPRNHPLSAKPVPKSTSVSPATSARMLSIQRTRSLARDPCMLDPDGEPVAAAVPARVMAAAAQPPQIRASVTGLLGGGAELGDEVLGGVGGRRENGGVERSTSRACARATVASGRDSRDAAERE